MLGRRRLRVPHLCAFHKSSGFFLNNDTVGEERTCTGREFHKFTTLFVKKLCFTNSLDLNLKSVRLRPLVVSILLKVKG